jgi:hypothetical protein
MFRALRSLLNTVFFNSPYIFDDGSQISYHAQFDILRYESGGRIPRILDIGLKYNPHTRIFRIGTTEMWRWRDPDVPLNSASASGSALTEEERKDVVQKLHIFREKHRKKFDLI